MDTLTDIIANLSGLSGDELNKLLYQTRKLKSKQVHEGIGNNGISLIIETLTDNRNRTASEIRSILSKNGGSLGETGSVSFNFDKIGEIRYDLSKISKDNFFNFTVEIGAIDVVEENEYITATCSQSSFGKFRDDLENKFGEPLKAKLIWQVKNNIKVEESALKKILLIIDMLEENDDVQEVYTNVNF